MVWNGVASDKIEYVIQVLGHYDSQIYINRFVGPKVMTILQDGRTFPIGGVALGRVCACSRHSRLVCKQLFDLQTPILLELQVS